MTANLVTDLRNRLGSDNAQITVLGKDAVNDSGGGKFYWDATSVEADDGGNIIKVNSIATGRWKRVDIGMNALRDRSTHYGFQLAATISDFAATTRATALTGLSLTTSTDITATDTLLTAPGKLQKQLTDLKASIPTDTEMQVGTNNTKFVTALRLTTWFTWIKTQAQTITARWIFSIIRFAASSTPTGLGDGDLWYENTDKRLRFQKGDKAVDVLFTHDNKSLAGVNDRLVRVNQFGDTSAIDRIDSGIETDAAIIAAIESATYNSSNNFKANIIAGGKIMYAGKWYFSTTSAYIYFAINDNYVVRWAAN